MIATQFPVFPRLYEPPTDLARLLRQEDAGVEFLYFGWGAWMLARYNPRDFAVAAAGRALFGHTTPGGEHQKGAIELLELWYSNQQKYRANPGAFRRLYKRYLYWLLVWHGGQPIAQYDALTMRELGLEYVLLDFRRMTWLYRHRSDQETLDEMNEESDRKAADPGPLGDPYFHKQQADWLFKRTHATTRHDDPEKHRVRSGFTRVATIRPGRSGLIVPA